MSFKITTSDVLFALAMLCIVGGFRLVCHIAVWAMHMLGVI